MPLARVPVARWLARPAGWRAHWRAGWRVDAASGARPVGALAGEQTLLITTTLPLARGSPSDLAAPLACPVSARMSGWRRGCLWRSLRVHTCLSRVHTCLWRCPRSFLRVGLGAGEALGPFYFWLGGPLDLSLGPFPFFRLDLFVFGWDPIFLAGNLDPLLPSFLDPRSPYVHTCILSLAIAVNIIFRSIISSILVVANIITTIIIIIIIIILSRFGF